MAATKQMLLFVDIKEAAVTFYYHSDIAPTLLLSLTMFFSHLGFVIVVSMTC